MMPYQVETFCAVTGNVCGFGQLPVVAERFDLRDVVHEEEGSVCVLGLDVRRVAYCARFGPNSGDGSGVNCRVARIYEMPILPDLKKKCSAVLLIFLSRSGELIYSGSQVVNFSELSW